MKRRRPGAWFFLVLAAALSISPRAFRLRARQAMLSVLARVSRLLASQAEASSEEDQGAGQDEREVRRLELEVARLSHALRQAGAVPEVLRGGAGVSLVPVDAVPLGGGTSLTRRLLLSEGANLGIARGQAAVIGGALAGIVVTVAERAAELRLVTDPAFRIRGVTAKGQLEGLVSGTAGSRMFFEVAPEEGRGEVGAIELGELVMTSPRSALCPVPSRIGRITKIERFGAVIRATLSPVVDERAIASVVILRPRTGLENRVKGRKRE